MNFLSSYWLFIPLFLFIIAVIFRLLDNSTLLFLKKDILVQSSNVSRKVLKRHIVLNEDPEFTRQLKRALLYRNFQQSFLIIAAISVPPSLYLFLS
ncbi:hypothetical protein MKO06_03910 [Gramella sp. GC03-9]|uniref:Uncharacterized protein n=1 Tax=Christiangramia oceanisediminis TaxID=2920386 RepID=A0A9X2I0J3_9FLAO|nr:hypothetical protein [Gramella oceanisediminis]MCP9199039.1 hypothetical protein [Gramella oceanisediminis]